MIRLNAYITSVLLFVMAAPSTHAQQKDVTFFVIGKHAKFNQSNEGDLTPVDFSFFSEIFLTPDGDASNAFLNMPTGERIRFRDQRLVEGPDKDNLLLIRGAKRFSTYADLQSWYPDGRYSIEFDSPSGAVSNAALEFPRNGLPSPPTISLYQDGVAMCSMVDSNKDLEIRWSNFSQGSADESGILDDLIFVILEDETGRRVSHSGRPFEGKPFLTYADTFRVIEASVLTDGMEYTLTIEHAVLTDVQRLDTVPAMTTYAVTTQLNIKAVAAAVGCASNKTKDGTTVRPTTESQVVMFYYKDLADANYFYGTVLGLDKTLDYDWVKMYTTSSNGTVGLVAESEGAWHRAQETNAVMLSIVTREVDAWYSRLRGQGDVTFLKEIETAGPIRSFLVEDPGGYTVEFFEWLDPSENTH